ncbi:MAG TPA: winged helix-turn-helix domain-containing protein, partial [Candidatus Hydrogenedentes bacterium]|jgi:DNA-binding response OmpR family regulator|nr:winged helix-turn-helix domain-containing protein [Candidatus Hydrogenedentota bacterium]
VKTSVLRFGDLEINLSRREALKGRRHLPLRPREYALLELLALRQGAVVSRAEIERQIYDERVSPMSNVVDSAVCNLRKMIDTPGAPSWIETRRGMGYLFGEPQA